MILKKTGAGEFRELTPEERDSLFMRSVGCKESEVKRPLEFLMKGQNSKTATMIDSRESKVYNSTKSVWHTFNAFENGTTVTYAYAHEVIMKTQGGMIVQELHPKFAAQLKIQFKRDKKKISVPLDNLDRALYLAIYPECNVSPYRGKRSSKYDLFQPKVKAKADIKKIRKIAAIENMILNELDIDTLRAYVAARGRKDAAMMDIEELQVMVLMEAKKDPEAFELRINSGVTNVRADVVNILSKGILIKRKFKDKYMWSFGKGEQTDEILFETLISNDDVTAVTNKLFDDTNLYERIRNMYFLSEGKTSSIQKVAETAPSFIGHSKMKLVDDLVQQKKIAYLIPQKLVYRVDPNTGKKQEKDGDLFKATSKETWVQEFAEYLAENPEIEAIITE